MAKAKKTDKSIRRETYNGVLEFVALAQSKLGKGPWNRKDLKALYLANKDKKEISSHVFISKQENFKTGRGLSQATAASVKAFYGPNVVDTVENPAVKAATKKTAKAAVKKAVKAKKSMAKKSESPAKIAA